MRKITYVLGVCGLILLLLACKKKEKEFDKSLLSGKWNQGSVYDRYLADGTGWTWDTSDDMTEEDARKFEWTLSNADFTIIDIGEMGHRVPKLYTMTELTSSSLKYKDDYGKSYSFQKVD